MVGTFEEELEVAIVSRLADSMAIYGTHIVFIVGHGEVLSLLSWAEEGMPLSVAAARRQCAPLSGAQIRQTLVYG